MPERGPGRVEGRSASRGQAGTGRTPPLAPLAPFSPGQRGHSHPHDAGPCTSFRPQSKADLFRTHPETMSTATSGSSVDQLTRHGGLAEDICTRELAPDLGLAPCSAGVSGWLRVPRTSPPLMASMLGMASRTIFLLDLSFCPQDLSFCPQGPRLLQGALDLCPALGTVAPTPV